MMRRTFMWLISLICIPAIAQRYHDAALFNAPNGKVKYIEYNTGRICFDEDGKIDFKQSTYLTLYDKFEISYDEQGYPVTLTTNVDEQTIKYEDFDEDKNPIYGVSVQRYIVYILTPGSFFSRLPATVWKRD